MIGNVKQALILCGGKAKRLRPYSYSLPKASFPFLNLPLLSFSWFYLEQMKVSHFLLNSHLFPEKLKNTVRFLSQTHQETNFFFEEEPLGSAGTLRELKKDLQKTEDFVYINGDSLFFPSCKKDINSFEEVFFSFGLDALFFVIPYKDQKSKRALWCDKDLNLKFVGSKEDLAPNKWNQLAPFTWAGLALFKSSLLDSLKDKAFDLFQDFISPLLKTKKVKVYVDSSAVLLEAGDKASYLQSTKFCLDCLFQEGEVFKKSDKMKRTAVKSLLESCFCRFDFSDEKVGLKNGKTLSQKLGYPLLLPKSVRGLDFLKLQGSAVIGSEVCFFGPALLEDCVLDSKIAFKGPLKKDLLLKAI